MGVDNAFAIQNAARPKKTKISAPTGIPVLWFYENPMTIRCQTAETQVAQKSGFRKSGQLENYVRYYFTVLRFGEYNKASFAISDRVCGSIIM